jgi:hypothetical protein
MKRATLFLTLALTIACSQEKQAASDIESTAAPTVASAGALTPEQLGALGAQIRKEPGRADELLRKHNLDREQFDKAIRDVTESVEASRRYADAYRKASA